MQDLTPSRAHHRLGINPFHVEPMYYIRGPGMGHAEIVHRGTHQPIPKDEPIFLLRASDPAAIAALRAYADACGSKRPKLRDTARRLVERFYNYAQAARAMALTDR